MKGELSPINIHSAKSRASDYTVSPDKQYKVDYDAPITGVSASDEGRRRYNDNGGRRLYFALTAVKRRSRKVNINGRTDGEAVCYQASA